MEIKQIALTELYCRPEDLKLTEDSMQAWKIADSIKEYGQLFPIICYQNDNKFFILHGTLIFKALRYLEKQNAFILDIGARTEEEVLKIWSALNLNNRAINYIELAKKIKEYPEIKKALGKQTVLLQDEIESLEKILDFDWSCFAKAKARAEGPDMFGGLFDGD